MRDTANIALPRRHLAMLALFEELGPDTHLRAADVHERLRARLPGVGLATVHRGLARLTAAGRLMCVDLPGSDASVYELCDRPHAHFVCTACRAILDVPHVFTDEELERIAAAVGGTVATSALTLHGTCARCTPASSEEDAPP